MDTTPDIATIGEMTMLDAFRHTKRWWQSLMKRWWLIVLLGIAGGLSGILYASLEKAKYESRLTFALEDNGGGLSGALSIAADFGFNLGGSGNTVFSGDNIMSILTSRMLVEQVLLSADTSNGKVTSMADIMMRLTKLDKQFTNHKRLGTIRFPVGQSRALFTYHQDSVLYLLYDRILKTDLVVNKPDKKLNLYEVNFTSTDEKFSRRFTERLVAEAMAFYTELRVKRSRETVDILANRVAEMRGSAKSAMQSTAAIRDANMNPALASQAAAVQQRQLDITAYGGAYGELFKNLELARYQYLKDIPLLQVIDEPRYPLKMKKIGRLKASIIGGMFGGFLSILLIMMLQGYGRIKKLESASQA